MLPEIDNLVEFNEDVLFDLPVNRTYKLNVEDNLYFDDYLNNITFEIKNGCLIEKIKDVNIPIRFEIEDNDLIVFIISEGGEDNASDWKY